MSDEVALINQVQNGDTEAFGSLYDAYIDKIYRFIYYKVFSKEVAEDLTSDTFYKALQKLNSFDTNKGSFNSWLYQIARNTVIDYYRTKSSDVPLGDTFDIGFEARTSEQIDALAGLKKVEKYMATLTAKQREIITLRIWEGMSYAEIAAVVGGSEDSVKMVFSRSIKTLRTECGEAALLLLLLGPSLTALPFNHLSYYIDIWLT